MKPQYLTAKAALALCTSSALIASPGLFPAANAHILNGRMKSTLSSTGYLPSPRQSPSAEFDGRLAPDTTGSPLDSASPLNVKVTPGVWSPLGQGYVLNSQSLRSSVTVAGRVTSIAVTGSSIYVGGADGGVWKSTIGDFHWSPLTDNQASLSIGSIAIDPKNSQVIYAATGEQHFSGDSYFGQGILKSTNAGSTWTMLGASTFAGQHIGKIVVSASNSSTLFVAADKGLFKSTDGGTTWTNILDNQAEATDVELSAQDPSTLYATFKGKGIWKTTDGGTTWTQLTNGLPATGFGVIGLAVAPSNGSIVYASFSTDDAHGDELYGFYKSTDGGATWTQLANAPQYFDASYSYGFSPGEYGQGQYDNCIVVDPHDPNHVLAGGVTLIESTDGGQTWSDLANPNSANFAVDLHPDQHALTFDANGDLFVGNDGGVWERHAAGTWQDLNTGLGLLQFSYGVSSSKTAIIGGTQDNGTNVFTSSGEWRHILDGDGGYTALDPTDPKTIYAETAGSDFVVSHDAGETWQYTGPLYSDDYGVPFLSPFILSPENPNEIWLGADRVYVSQDKGMTWQAVSPLFQTTKTDQINTLQSKDGAPNDTTDPISVIVQSPRDPNVLYVGTQSGQVFATFDGAQNWTAITPNGADDAAGITGIAIDPNNDKQIYVTYGGYKYPKANAHVFHCPDTSLTTPAWKDVTGNLPDSPVDALLQVGQKILVGTDHGVYVSPVGGSTWGLAAAGMPNTLVVGLNEDASGHIIATTHGRGAFITELASSTSLAMSQGYSTMAVGEHQQFRTKASGRDVTALTGWSSSNPQVATVSSTGVVTAVGNGTTTITASYNGVVTKFNVTVHNVSRLSVSLSKTTIYHGGTAYIKVLAVLDDSSQIDVTSQVGIKSQKGKVRISGNQVYGAVRGSDTLIVSFAGKLAYVNLNVN